MRFQVKLFLWCVISTLLITGCGNNEAEDFTKVELVKSPFILGVTSYLNADQVIRHLLLDKEKFKIIEQNEGSKLAKMPPFKYVIASVNEFEVKEYGGSIEFVFFNDRLLEIKFFPKQFQYFVNTIPGLSDTHQIDISPYTRIWIGVDHKNRQYIAWTDVRLEKQFNRWIKNYT